MGPYQIEDLLGAGGMGEVYRARDTRLHRTVAIKLLPSDWLADADRKLRFLREARAASALSHPNIVTLYDIASDNGRDYLVLAPHRGPRAMVADFLVPAVQRSRGTGGTFSHG